MRKLLIQSAVAVLLFAGVAAGNPPNPPSGAPVPKLPPQSSAVQGDQSLLQPYTSAEGRFTVTIPGGAPKTSSEVIQLKGGGSGTLYEYWTELENNNISYMVMYNDYSADYANGGPQTVLAAARDGAVAGKTLLSDMVISLNGVPGREFTAKDDNWDYTVRRFLQGRRRFQMIVVSNSAHPATQTSAFMDSFKIN